MNKKPRRVFCPFLKDQLISEIPSVHQEMEVEWHQINGKYFDLFIFDEF